MPVFVGIIHSKTTGNMEHFLFKILITYSQFWSGTNYELVDYKQY
jgi:hypothetical protein